MDLRRNHEAETHQADWERAVESWNGNEKDVPRISSAKETAFTRRFRGVRLSAKYTCDPNKVSIEDKVFLADPNLGEWLASPRAGLAFWKAFLIPWIETHSEADDRKIVAEPGPQVAKDTCWLIARMAGEPDVEGDFGSEQRMLETIAIETHIAATT